jgi:hypothetical protein
MRLAGSWHLSILVVFAMAATRAARSNDHPLPEPGDYNLFNPVPADRLRELSPDRPDKTESPYTVDAGHFQLELDFANFTYNQTDRTTLHAWNLAPFNLKAGLLENVDFQIIFDNYLCVRTEDRPTGTTTTQSGVGDLTARLKLNLWGNNGGLTAFGLLPYIKFPTSSDGLGNHAIEGGVIFPLAVKLPRNFDLGMETGVSCLRNENDDGSHAGFINSITIGHGLVGRLGGYLEFFSEISTERHSGWVGTIDAGLTFSLTENVRLDGGCNFGVTPAAADYNPFTGLTWRF